MGERCSRFVRTGGNIIEDPAGSLGITDRKQDAAQWNRDKWAVSRVI